MNILLTNDDGYNSEGILLLKEKLSKYGTVVVVAPLEHMSAKSTSITLGRGFEVKQIDETTFAVDGTPADCVSFACNALSITFDLVVSGCNAGLNISYDTMYSGTIGAALEGLRNKIPSVAFSCHFNFELVREHFDEVFEYILNKNILSIDYLLNVNFPKGEEHKGIKISTLYYRDDKNFFVKKDDGYWAYRNCETDFSKDKNSDCYLVENGYTSITPLNKSFFNRELYDKIK